MAARPGTSKEEQRPRGAGEGKKTNGEENDATEHNEG